MTKRKDLKDLIRARMKKTGESYSAARASFLGPEAKHVGPRSKWAALAGIKDATLTERTGNSWSGWVETLDKARAFEWDHSKIAKYLTSQFAVSAWWAQSVTVGYERIHGIREVGQSCDGSFEANKSKTFTIPIAGLFEMWVDAELRETWLGVSAANVRNERPNKSLIMDWPDGSQVNVYFLDKGSRSAVQLQHRKLESKQDIQSRKRFWEERLAALKAAL